MSLQGIGQKSGTSKAQSNNFDSLRLFFAVLVIFSHSFPLTRGSNETEPLSRLTFGQVNLGNISVWAFFAISGFLITRSWERAPHILPYLRKRAGRIYPGFLVAAVLTALFVYPFVADPPTYRPVGILTVLFSALQLKLFAASPVFVRNPLADSLNGSLWSVPMEFWCYIGVMVLGLAGLLRRRLVVVAIFAIAIAAHLFIDITDWNPGGALLGKIFGYPRFWANVLPFYLAGTLFHLYGGKQLLRRSAIVAAASTLIAANFIPHALVVFMPLCGSYLLMALAYWSPLHPLHLGRFGDFSYGTYLYAFPIQQLLVMRVHGQISPWILFAEAAPITLILGALSWFLVERHFLQRGSILKHEGILPREPAVQVERT